MGNVSSSGASTSKYGTDSRGWGQPAPMAAAQPIPPTSYYHAPPPAVIVPLADPTTHSQQIQFVLNSQPLDKTTQFIWMQLAHKEDISLKRGSVYVGYCQRLYVPEGTPGFTEWTLISIKWCSHQSSSYSLSVCFVYGAPSPFLLQIFVLKLFPYLRR